MFITNSTNFRYLRNPEEGGGGGTEGQPEGGKPAEQPKGKFTPIGSQEELDRIVQERVRRVENKFKDYEAVKAKADQFDVLARESQTDREREIEEARLEAFHEAMSKTVPVAVRAEFKNAAKGVISDQALQSLLEDLDLTRYATDEGEPDEDKIAQKVAAFAPAKGAAGRGSSTGFGQGTRQDAVLRRGEGGLAEAQRRFGQKTGS